jgi:hypothetical protein
MPDEITPGYPETPAVIDEASVSTAFDLNAEEPVFTSTLPEFTESVPYAQESAIPVQDETPLEVRLIAELHALNSKVDALIQRSDATIGRIDWIAPRIDWIQRTFQGLIDQFGKITPGQVFSMLRGKAPAPTQEGTPQ